ncbi:MAG TPA: sigma 54-interacting transcriptional regulator [Terriglobales bacterium]|nr:sigma 54-interacting transcriptional regulator [Terriglobales bacterium]
MASDRILPFNPEMTQGASQRTSAASLSFHSSGNPFLGTSAAIRQLENDTLQYVNSNSPVLIQGEPGTGKGVLARWLHESGPRGDELQVELQCMGVSQLRVEAKLFGYEKGAFGAPQAKPGLLEIAQSGSVFIDEIGELDLPLQKKILRLLEENKFRRLGDTQDRQSDARVIVSSQRNVGERVKENRFSQELALRLGNPLTVPALRERPEDIAVLAGHLLEHIAAEHEVGPIHLAAPALELLQVFSWPGNIRELRNTLERAVLVSGGQQLSENDLQLNRKIEAGNLQPGSLKTLNEVEREYIQSVLSLEGGRVQSAAKKLGIPRSSLYHKLKQYGIARRGVETGTWNRNIAGA